jgi:phosphoesterase RecJ-like protein
VPTERMRRVNMVLREVLAEGVEALEDPGLGFVTITSVRATSDLSQATVYVSVLGSEKRRARSLRALDRAHGVLQSRVARELHFKRTPQLSFHYDETIDQAMRLEELISREQEPPVEAFPGMTDIALETDLESVVAALAAADRVLIATHENPDGDAIGSMSAAAGAMRQLGKQVRTFLEPESSIPHEVAFLDTDGLERQVDPASLAGWTLLALDCGNERRIGAQYSDLLAGCSPVIDVDHHHDNSRFGNVNLIDGSASSTAEILVRIFDRLGAEITPAIAEALYVGLVTDTGRFQYRTTSPAALRLGARLVEAGVDVHKVFERVFESVQPGKLRLLGRVIDHSVAYCDGRVLISHVSRDDLALVEGDEATTEGLIDHLRAVEGVQVAGLIREQVPLGDGSLAPNRVSLRSRGLIDVSAIARLSSGGGHKQAAGFSHPGSVDDIRRFIVSEVSAQLAESAA